MSMKIAEWSIKYGKIKDIGCGWWRQNESWSTVTFSQEGMSIRGRETVRGKHWCFIRKILHWSYIVMMMQNEWLGRMQNQGRKRQNYRSSCWQQGWWRTKLTGFELGDKIYLKTRFSNSCCTWCVLERSGKESLPEEENLTFHPGGIMIDQTAHTVQWMENRLNWVSRNLNCLLIFMENEGALHSQGKFSIMSGITITLEMQNHRYTLKTCQDQRKRWLYQNHLGYGNFLVEAERKWQW